jgi:hypothetical protein
LIKAFRHGRGQVNAEQVFKIQKNLFPFAHSAIDDWNTFPWHRDRDGNIETIKVNSSQAIAIDVFGTIKNSSEKGAILTALARQCGIIDDGPWELELECIDNSNRLAEKTPTQIDVVAIGDRSILAIECKFTERGGSCSQTKLISIGGRKVRQCTGNYEPQTNPRSGKEGRCSLTQKGIGYWKGIPEIFGIDSEQDHMPCPFKGEAFQWMRNTVLAHQIATESGRSGRVVAAFANAPNLYMAEAVRRGEPKLVFGTGKQLVTPISYQSVIRLAQSIAPRSDKWIDLDNWVSDKIHRVASGANGVKPWHH